MRKIHVVKPADLKVLNKTSYYDGKRVLRARSQPEYRLDLLRQGDKLNYAGGYDPETSAVQALIEPSTASVGISGQAPSVVAVSDFGTTWTQVASATESRNGVDAGPDGGFITAIDDPQLIDDAGNLVWQVPGPSTGTLNYHQSQMISDRVGNFYVAYDASSPNASELWKHSVSDGAFQWSWDLPANTDAVVDCFEDGTAVFLVNSTDIFRLDSSGNQVDLNSSGEFHYFSVTQDESKIAAFALHDLTLRAYSTSDLNSLEWTLDMATVPTMPMMDGNSSSRFHRDRVGNGVWISSLEDGTMYHVDTDGNLDIELDLFGDTKIASPLDIFSFDVDKNGGVYALVRGDFECDIVRYSYDGTFMRNSTGITIPSEAHMVVVSEQGTLGYMRFDTGGLIIISQT